MTFELLSAATDLRDVDVAVVVDVRWLGRSWLLSTRELVGDVHVLPGLLQVPAIDQQISLDSIDTTASASLGVVLHGIDVKATVSAGYDLDDMTAEVSLVWHRRGAMAHDWKDRQIVCQGDADDPQYGDPTQPAGAVALTITDSPYRVRQPIVPRTWAVTEETFPSAPSFGERIPLPIGAPDPEGNGGGPPAPILSATTGSANTLAVTMGWTNATTVDIVDADGATETFTILWAVDGLGQRYGYVSVTSAGTIDRTSSSFSSSWANGAALLPFGNATPVATAAYLLSLGGADIDLPEWIRVASLTAGAVGGYVDDPDTEGWEVARDLLKGLPIRTRRDRAGWAPVVIDPAVAEALWADTWTEGGPYRRVSGWQGFGDSRVGRVELITDANELTIGSSVARDGAPPHGWIRHLPRLSEATAQSAWSWKGDVDHRSVQWSARIGAMGWEASAWQTPAPYGRVREGDWILLNETDGTSRYALVQRRSLSGGVWDYTLVRPRGR